MNVKTIIYSDAHTLSDEKIQDNVVFNENSDDMIIYYYIIGVHWYIVHTKYSNDILIHVRGMLDKCREVW